MSERASTMNEDPLFSQSNLLLFRYNEMKGPSLIVIRIFSVERSFFSTESRAAERINAAADWSNCGKYLALVFKHAAQHQGKTNISDESTLNELFYLVDYLLRLDLLTTGF